MQMNKMEWNGICFYLDCVLRAINTAHFSISLSFCFFFCCAASIWFFVCAKFLPLSLFNCIELSSKAFFSVYYVVDISWGDSMSLRTIFERLNIKLSGMAESFLLAELIFPQTRWKWHWLASQITEMTNIHDAWEFFNKILSFIAVFRLLLLFCLTATPGQLTSNCTLITRSFRRLRNK